MNIKQADFSFEESLKYVDGLLAQLKDDSPLPVCDTLTKEDLFTKDIAQAHCTTMMVKVERQPWLKEGRIRDYVFHAAINLMMGVIRSTKTLRHLDVQADGGLLALFDTPMKKNVEEVIILSAQVRSVNDVVLKKFRQDLTGQSVTVGVDYGSVICYNGDDPIEDLFFAGKGIETAKFLAERKDNCVVISHDIYINLSEEMQKNLFKEGEKEGDLQYYFSPLINIKMREWVEEQK